MGTVLRNVGGGGAQRLVHLVVPSLGRNFFAVKKAVHDGVGSIFDMDYLRLEGNYFTLFFQGLAIAFYSFSLDLTDKSGTPELVLYAAADANL